MTESAKLEKRDQVILWACRAAALVLERRGYAPDEIANGMISFGGAVAVDLMGIDRASDLFSSKARGLKEKVQ